MASSLNKVILIGNLGKDPEVRSDQRGGEIISFTLATTEQWRDKASGEKRERTEWHRVVVFNDKLASIIKNYLHKGSKVYIEGALQTRKWTDKTGVERYTTEVVLQNYNSSLVLLGGKGESSGFDNSDSHSSRNDSGFGSEPRSSHDVGSSSSFSAAEDLEDEIPF